MRFLALALLAGSSIAPSTLSTEQDAYRQTLKDLDTVWVSVALLGNESGLIDKQEVRDRIAVSFLRHSLKYRETDSLTFWGMRQGDPALVGLTVYLEVKKTETLGVYVVQVDFRISEPVRTDRHPKEVAIAETYSSEKLGLTNGPTLAKDYSYRYVSDLADKFASDWKAVNKQP